MITIISAIIGFLASIIPALIKLYEKNQDYYYEVKLRELEIDATIKGVSIQARLEEVKAAVEEARSVYEHDESIAGSPFINELRASVRPVITYTFFGLFVFVKLVALFTAIYQGVSIDALSSVVWDDFTASIFSAIVCFWFGSRVWDKSPTFGFISVANLKKKVEKE